MLYRDIAKIASLFFFGMTICLCIPLALAIYYEYFVDPLLHPQPHTSASFLITTLIAASVAALCYRIGRTSKGQLFRKEAFLAVGIIWFATPAIAALPFYLSSTLSNPFQAYFEAASGFTTTGATTMTPKKYNAMKQEIPIVKRSQGVREHKYLFYGTVTPVRNQITGEIIAEGVEAVSKALLFWRSFMQWLGGVGIVVLFAAILPVLGVGGKMLFQAEVTGPVKESLTPRLKETAMHLWKIYLGLTFLEILMLKVTNPSLDTLDLFTITFSTLSTGGYTIKNASIGAFNSAATEWVVMAFMFLGSVSFTYYFYALRGKLFRLYEPEFYVYIIILLSACLFSAYMLVGEPKLLLTDSGIEGSYSILEAIRYGFFQLISAQTSTGFTTANYDIWPSAVQTVMLIVMFLGGMAGSTAGGMKIMRPIMLFRIAQWKVESLFRPEMVRKLRVGGKEVDMGSAILVLCFFLTVVALSVLATLFYVIDGVDVESALGVTVCVMNNTGIGFQMNGPTGSCAFLSNSSLIISSILMIMARLEFFAILAILVPAFWKQD